VTAEPEAAVSYIQYHIEQALSPSVGLHRRLIRALSEENDFHKYVDYHAAVASYFSNVPVDYGGTLILIKQSFINSLCGGNP